MKAFVYSARPYDKDALSRENSPKHELVFSELELRLNSAQLASGCEAVALFTADDASGTVLDALQRIGVRHIALRSVGYDHVDLAAARRLGIRIC